MPAPTADGPIFDHDHIDQDHAAYRPDDHAVWSTLYRRQREVLAGRAVPQFLDGLARLGLGEAEIPRFDVLNERLGAASGFTVEAVAGLIPDRDFYALLAERRFPVTRWIRAAGLPGGTPCPPSLRLAAEPSRPDPFIRCVQLQKASTGQR